MDCLGPFFRHVQTCDVTRVQSDTEWTRPCSTSLRAPVLYITFGGWGKGRPNLDHIYIVYYLFIFAQTAGLQPWSYCVCSQQWKLASHIANLPEHRWVRKILAWNPSVRYRSLGRRPHTWDYQIQPFCRYKGLGPWLEEKTPPPKKKGNTIITGMHFLEISTLFARSERNVKLHAKRMYIFLFTACAQNGFALWRTGIDH